MPVNATVPRNQIRSTAVPGDSAAGADGWILAGRARSAAGRAAGCPVRDQLPGRTARRRARQLSRRLVAASMRRARTSTGIAPAMISAETMMTAYNTHGVCGLPADL